MKNMFINIVFVLVPYSNILLDTFFPATTMAELAYFCYSLHVSLIIICCFCLRDIAVL
jgi:hypothetical protein